MPVIQNDKCIVLMARVHNVSIICTLVNGYISKNGRKCLATMPSYDV